MVKQKTKPFTPWHRLLGKLFELLLTPLGVTVSVEFKLMSDPPRGDILLLRRQQPRWTIEQLAYLPDGIRHSQASDILVEFKYSESLTAQTIAKVLSYDTLYRDTQEVPSHQVESFILCSKTPRSALLKDYGYRPTEWPGVYQSDNILLKNVKLLLLNDLSNEPHNAFVKCFASRSEVVQTAFKILDLGHWTNKLWGFLLGLKDFLTEKGAVMTKRKEITPEYIMEIGDKMFEGMLASMPAEEVLARYKPADKMFEAMLARMPTKEVLSHYKPEEVLSQYKPELERRAEQTKYQTKYQTIVQQIERALRLRFRPNEATLTQVSAHLQKLDLAKLEQLSETAILANQFADFELALQETLAHI
jgi:hypothetical protein